MLLCGGPLLLMGVVASYVSLFDRPSRSSEAAMAMVAAVMGLSFGVGFLVWLFPPEWGVARRLWRWAGWLPGLSLVGLGVVTVGDPVEAAEQSERIGSAATAIIRGVAVGGLGAALVFTWIRTAFRRRR
jgi:hypothetical protein